jgi:hypothetical protein
LLYLASLPPDQPVAWGRRIAAELRMKKLGRLSPSTVYDVLDDFRREKLVEEVKPKEPPPGSPTEALVDTASTDEERRKLKVTEQLLRAGYIEDELNQMDERFRKRHEEEELEKKLEERHRKREFHGLAGLWPREVKWLAETKRRTGFRPPDPRANGYRLIAYGRKIAELLKQKDLLTEWWSCRDSPTDNANFLAKLHARGFDQNDIKAAKNIGVLVQLDKQAEEHPGTFTYGFQGPTAIAQSLVRPKLVASQQLSRYRLA